MLKKLVKYGNSNALILDKAILEVLNIEEGSIVKLKTDGKSIIITPRTKATSGKVHDIFTHNQASIEANVEKALEKYVNIGGVVDGKLKEKVLNLTKRSQELHVKLTQNPDFIEEISRANGLEGLPSAKSIEIYKALRGKYSPELVKVEKEMESLCNMQRLSPKQKKAMEKEMLAHFKKYNNVTVLYGTLLNNPAYQHKAQLIAEKYNSDKKSSEYLKAIDELTYSYHPEIKESKEALAVITDKYFKKI